MYFNCLHVIFLTLCVVLLSHTVKCGVEYENCQLSCTAGDGSVTVQQLAAGTSSESDTGDEKSQPEPEPKAKAEPSTEPPLPTVPPFLQIIPKTNKTTKLPEAVPDIAPVPDLKPPPEPEVVSKQRCESNGTDEILGTNGTATGNGTVFSADCETMEDETEIEMYVDEPKPESDVEEGSIESLASEPEPQGNSTAEGEPMSDSSSSSIANGTVQLNETTNPEVNTRKKRHAKRNQPDILYIADNELSGVRQKRAALSNKNCVLSCKLTVTDPLQCYTCSDSSGCAGKPDRSSGKLVTCKPMEACWTVYQSHSGSGDTGNATYTRGCFGSSRSSNPFGINCEAHSTEQCLGGQNVELCAICCSSKHGCNSGKLRLQSAAQQKSAAGLSTKMRPSQLLSTTTALGWPKTYPPRKSWSEFVNNVINDQQQQVCSVIFVVMFYWILTQ